MPHPKLEPRRLSLIPFQKSDIEKLCGLWIPPEVHISLLDNQVNSPERAVEMAKTILPALNLSSQKGSGQPRCPSRDEPPEDDSITSWHRTSAQRTIHIVAHLKPSIASTARYLSGTGSQ